MRTNLNHLRKQLTDKDQARTAEITANVLEEVKALLAGNPKALVIVQELKAYSSKKALDRALKQVKALSAETSAMFFSVDSEAKKIVCLSAVPESAVNRGLKANEWVQQVSGLMQGKGGGKPEAAQASGSNVSCLQEALGIAAQFANAKLNSSS
ncbi:hypothetical protein B7P43_G15040 [Cryptotermes secundus]|uniref:DHHA1 domain-containing protein n=2 Tax=Cryptotermes secundus TaxID=105785 RepID=A0A2J7PBK3_9NEOP|nr:hypothetical protein B7P43_G15040 [Cryptotermes secundus]